MQQLDYYIHTINKHKQYYEHNFYNTNNCFNSLLSTSIMIAAQTSHKLITQNFLEEFKNNIKNSRFFFSSPNPNVF